MLLDPIHIWRVFNNYAAIIPLLQEADFWVLTLSITFPVELTIDRLTAEVAINDELLDKEITSEHLKAIAHGITRWKLYAKCLGLDHHQIEDIESDKDAESLIKMHNVLKKWHKKYCFKASYRVMIKACLKLEDGKAARNVCKMLKGI